PAMAKVRPEDVDAAIETVMSSVFPTIKDRVINGMGVSKPHPEVVWQIASKLTVAVELELVRTTNHRWGAQIADAIDRSG
ncbi:MAG: hypothetical protein NXI14_09155, partial [bacterium]|nr:hypothetical protein [bacterium]